MGVHNANWAGMKFSRGNELLIIFRPKLTLAWLAGDPGDTLSVDSLEYRSMVNSDFTAFYNRIVDTSRCLVGIQVICLIEGIEIWMRIANLPFVSGRRASNTIRILFRDSLPRDLSILDDQAFGGRFYESITGVLAISMDVSWLSSRDLEAIEAAPADWITVG